MTVERFFWPGGPGASPGEGNAASEALTGGVGPGTPRSKRVGYLRQFQWWPLYTVLM